MKWSTLVRDHLTKTRALETEEATVKRALVFHVNRTMYNCMAYSHAIPTTLHVGCVNTRNIVIVCLQSGGHL